MRNYNEKRGAYGADAESYALDWLRHAGYNAISTKDYLGEDWSPALDAEMGDIQILAKDGATPIASIDVKRAGPYEPESFVGTISYTSASDRFRENPNAWYLLFSKSLKNHIWLKAVDIKNNPPKNGKFWTTSETLRYAHRD